MGGGGVVVVVVLLLLVVAGGGCGIHRRYSCYSHHIAVG